MGSIAVIGSGSWGTTLAHLLGDKGYDVSLWSFEADVVREINQTGMNSTYLPGVKLSDNIVATDSIEKALDKARYVLNAVPTQFTRSVFLEANKYISGTTHIVSASKGIEHGTLKTVSMILSELLDRDVAVLSGPSFASEVIRRMPTAVTIAAADHTVALLLQEVFNTDYFRVYTNADVLGVELGGAIKNVMAIASGISDGLDLGSSARAALITRGIAEIIRLGMAMGANEKTFSGLSGIGDLVLTCTGTLSRNYTVGVRLGKGEKLKDILAGMKMVAEGVATSKSAYELARKHNVEMPIIEQIYRVINEDTDPVDAVRELMSRSLKAE